MKKIIITIATTFLLAHIQKTNAQNTFPTNGSAGIGTSTPNSSSILEVKSTTKGILTPRMTKAQRDAIVSPAEGLLIYQTNSTPGFYYYTGAAWKAVSVNNVRGLSDNLFIGQNAGSAIGIGKSNIALGTAALKSVVDVGNNIAIGDSALANTGPAGIGLTTGINNIAIGTYSMLSNVNGYSNTVIGDGTMKNNTSGYYCVAVGNKSLFSNTTGWDNTAVGNFSLYKNTTGHYNTSFGSNSMNENQTGQQNTALGNFSLNKNTTGNDNTAVGFQSLLNNQTGLGNVAVGLNSLMSAKAENANSAAGRDALYTLRNGSSNSAFGWSSLYILDTGTYNTGLGATVLNNLKKGSSNVAIGYGAGDNLQNGDNNIFIGTNSRTTPLKTLNNAGAIGYNAIATTDNTLILGDTGTYAYSIGIGTTTPGAKVFISSALTNSFWSLSTKPNANGVVGEVNGGTAAYGVWGRSTNGSAGYFSGNLVYTGVLTNGSDERLKENIKPLTNVLEKIKNIDVRTYQFKKEYEKMNLAKGNQIGFIAQNLEKTFPELVINTYDKSMNDSVPFEYKSVNYIGMIPVITEAVKELDEAQKIKDEKIENLEKENAELRNEIEIIKQHLGIKNDEMKLPSVNETLESPDFLQNNPNPFSEKTTVNCFVPSSAGAALIKIVSVDGKEIKSIVIALRGNVQTEITSEGLSNGTYLCELIVDEKITATKKLTVLKQ